MIASTSSRLGPLYS